MTDTNTDLTEQIAKLEQEVFAMKERNRRVEGDKAWETSMARKGSILSLTYLTTALVFWVIGVSGPLLAAIIPSLGYLLSTLSLPVIKRRWLLSHKPGTGGDYAGHTSNDNSTHSC